MDVVDENQGSYGTSAASPVARKASGTSRAGRASPLGERARDAQGVPMETSPAKQAVGVRNPDSGANRPSPAARKSSSKRARRSGEGSGRSRRHTGDSFALADVLGSLASPAPGRAATLDGIGEDQDKEAASAGSGSGKKRSKKDRLRRTTADFSAINHLLDASVASEDSAPTAAAAAADSPREHEPTGRGYDD
ncbi:unnamed protein product, partial [Scytosiphon promiscuus]